MTDEQKPNLKWFEVTWTITEGLSKVKAETAEEAKKLASEFADKADQDRIVSLPEGRIVLHDWYDPTDQEPYISASDELSPEEGQEIEDGLEGNAE